MDTYKRIAYIYLQYKYYNKYLIFFIKMHDPDHSFWTVI